MICKTLVTLWKMKENLSLALCLRVRDMYKARCCIQTYFVPSPFLLKGINIMSRYQCLSSRKDYIYARNNGRNHVDIARWDWVKRNNTSTAVLYVQKMRGRNNKTTLKS